MPPTGAIPCPRQQRNYYAHSSRYVSNLQRSLSFSVHALFALLQRHGHQLLVSTVECAWHFNRGTSNRIDLHTKRSI